MPPSDLLNAAQLSLQKDFESSEDNCLSFLVFSLGTELYGTPLLSTREVIKATDIKATPFMIPSFMGVINLRGQIIGVIDLRKKFEITARNESGLILIVESQGSLIGAIVDDLISVEKIQQSDLDQKAKIETRIASDFFLGVAKIRDRLVNMVDIAGCLTSEEMRASHAA